MLRLTRKHASGMVKIEDRKPIAKDGKPTGEYEKIVLALGVQMCPKMVKEEKKDKDGNFVSSSYKIGTPGKSFQVNDETFVLSKYGAILEKC